MSPGLVWCTKGVVSQAPVLPSGTCVCPVLMMALSSVLCLEPWWEKMARAGVPWPGSLLHPVYR